MRKFSLICIIIICLAGCSAADKFEIKSADNAQRLDTYAGIAAYLQGQGLPGLKLTTTHYDIFTTLLEPFVLRGISGFMESAYRAYNSQLPEPVETKTKFIIYLFADPLTADELDQLDVEVSVLSPLQKTNEPLSLRLGVDGIYIKSGHTSGCFLPQVATETGWSKEEFLSYCCAHKAGLAPDAWREPETEVYLFTADVFGADFKDI